MTPPARTEADTAARRGARARRTRRRSDDGRRAPDRPAQSGWCGRPPHARRYTPGGWPHAGSGWHRLGKPPASIFDTAKKHTRGPTPSPRLGAPRGGYFEGEGPPSPTTDVGRARRLAGSVIDAEHARPRRPLSCTRTARAASSASTISARHGNNLRARALASTADTSRLAIWRLRALHELGTIEMFDHGGPPNASSEARRSADGLGAVSTGAVIDLQLCAALMLRFALDEAAQHARSALAHQSTARPGQGPGNRASVSWGEIHALLRREKISDMETISSALRRLGLRPGDPEIEGSAWAGGRGMLGLLDDDWGWRP